MAQTKSNTRDNIRKQLRDPKTGRVVANKSTVTLPLLESLDNAVKRTRELHLETPNCVIVLGAPGALGRSMVHGVFTANQWSADGKSAHEIRLAGESLRRGAVATLGTLLHELAHSIAHTRGVKDTSREGRYHNTRFRDIAEELGLKIEYDKQIGWSVTTVPDATQALYKAELREISKSLKAYRIPTVAAPRVRKTVRIACNCRAVTVAQSFFEVGPILCEACDCYFTEVNV